MSDHQMRVVLKQRQNKSSLLSLLKSTKLKIAFAKILYYVIIIFLRKNKREITRNNIRYSVDLSEGIDLSLFLFGNFQKHITNNSSFSLPKDAVIFDVGANFGVMSLQFAKAAQNGHVYAFEPTHYAFERLMKNLQLNPAIAQRITPVKLFLSDVSSKNPKITAFSSWKVDGQTKKDTVHPVHLGSSKSAQGVSAIRLDNFCKSKKITKVDFIKIDTDGHDYKVLKGARNTIVTYRPAVIFEVGDYLMKEQNIDFNFFLDYFLKLDYNLYDTESKIKLTRKNYQSVIPLYGTIDVIAIHKQ